MRMGRVVNVIVLLGWSVTRSPSTVPWQGRFQAGPLPGRAASRLTSRLLRPDNPSDWKDGRDEHLASNGSEFVRIRII